MSAKDDKNLRDVSTKMKPHTIEATLLYEVSAQEMKPHTIEATLSETGNYSKQDEDLKEKLLEETQTTHI